MAMSIEADLMKRGAKSLIFVGATIPELGAMFAMSTAAVRAKLNGMDSSGMRDGLPTWLVRNAAPRLCSLPDEIIEKIMAMKVDDLPTKLQKAYWDGKNQHLTYMERVGDLWATSAVVSLAGEAFKTIRLSLLLLTDSVERESKLDDAQREIITRLVDTILIEMQGKLVDGLRNGREHSLGKSFTQGEDDGASDL